MYFSRLLHGHKNVIVGTDNLNMLFYVFIRWKAFVAQKKATAGHLDRAIVMPGYTLVRKFTYTGLLLYVILCLTLKFAYDSAKCSLRQVVD